MLYARSGKNFIAIVRNRDEQPVSRLIGSPWQLRREISEVVIGSKAAKHNWVQCVRAVLV